MGGFLGGMEHRSADEGFVRGALGGLVFGSFILLGLEIINNEPEAHLRRASGGLVFATTTFGGILGALGALWRSASERRLETRQSWRPLRKPAASAGSIS